MSALAAAVFTTLPAFAQRGPAPVPTGLTPEVLALACAPSLVFEAPPTPLRITGGQEASVRYSFAPGDLVTINAGTENGIEIGQEYYTRRVQPSERRPVSRDNPATIRSTGWIRIYAVDTNMSLATITHACDTVDVGDFLEPFALPQVPVPDQTFARPQRSNYGRVQVGTDRRRTFGKGDFFIVDRGSDHGVFVGARFVVYRDHGQPAGLPGGAVMYRDRDQGLAQNGPTQNFLYDLGEAVAVDVRPENSTLQVTLSRDAFREGDWVAIRK
jgi:hypothetical protein